MADANKSIKVTIDVVVNQAKTALGQMAATTQQATKTLDSLAVSTDRAARSHKSFFSGMTLDVAKGVAAYDLFRQGVRVAFDFLKGAMTEAAEAEKNVAQLNAVLISTGGAAGVTAEAATQLASALSKQTVFTDDAILSAENLLLTFTKINKDIFPQATSLVLDMSTALGQDLKSSAIQLGKALQDPILGVTALRRVGVNFSEAQTDVIKKLVETGRAAEAQAMIMKELTAEFGGSAQAAALTYAGKLQQAKNAVGELQETIGTYMLPTITLFTQSIVQGINALFGFADASDIAAQRSGVNLSRGIQEVAVTVGNLVESLNPFGEKFGKGKFMDSLVSDLGGLNAVWEEQDAAAKKREELMARVQKSMEAIGETSVGVSEDAQAQEQAMKDLEKAYQGVVEGSSKLTFETAADFSVMQGLLTDHKAKTADWSRAVVQSFDALSSRIKGIDNDIASLNSKITDAQASFKQFVQSTTASAGEDFAQIVFDAEKAVKELPDKISETDSGDERQRLREQLDEAKEIVRQSRKAQYQENVEFVEQLAFLREQDGRNELEQAYALFERKIEQKKKETDATIAELQKQIDAQTQQRDAFAEAQRAMTTLFQQEVAARQKGSAVEIAALNAVQVAVNNAAKAYERLNAAATAATYYSTFSTATTKSTTTKRAIGGPVSAGQSYLIGENGPELFTPMVGGEITPNSRITRETGAVQIHINNPTVRNDNDIHAITRSIMDAFNRRDELASIGAYK